MFLTQKPLSNVFYDLRSKAENPLQEDRPEVDEIASLLVFLYFNSVNLVILRKKLQCEIFLKRLVLTVVWWYNISK